MKIHKKLSYKTMFTLAATILLTTYNKKDVFSSSFCFKSKAYFFLPVSQKKVSYHG